MKRILLSTVAGIAVLSVNQLGATIYNDATGDLNTSPGDNFSGFTHLDIVSAEINNTATDIIFTIRVAQSDIISPNNWGNYMIGINSVPGGSSGNAWNRPISMGSDMDYWLGSWVNDGGGHQLWNWNGSSWDGPASSGVSISGDSVTFSRSLASLGLGVGDTFTFDIYSSGSGGSDSAIDSLANPNISVSTWGQPYDSGSLVYSYTVVPEPAVLTFLGLTGLVFGTRLLRRRN